MKYQIVNKFTKEQPIFVGFFNNCDVKENSHLTQFDLISFTDSPFSPQQSQVGTWLVHEGQSIYLYNLGNKSKFSLTKFRKTVTEFIKQAKLIKVPSISLALPAIEIDQLENISQLLIQEVENSIYEFKICKKPAKPMTLEQVDLMIEDIEQSQIDRGQLIAQAKRLTKDLANMPPNLCTPTKVAEIATELASTDSKFQISIFDETKMLQMGMNTILAVSQGSDEEARFIELQYNNGGDSAPIVLVGKGITFDAGGLSLKTPTSMYEMKYDMSGAASVVGVMKAASLLSLPLNLVCLVACSENLPGPKAIKPGSVVKSYSEKTVEILNTDAEGRLILCDALTYAEQFNPAKVIDVATLTGAVIIALGHHANGIMTNDQSLCDDLLSAGNKSGDKGWQLPLWEEYQGAMDSNVADMCNTSSDRSAGSISAACFLSRFAEKYSWAHIDCAGTAWRSGKQKTATSRPVSMLVQFLEDEVAKNAN